MNNLSKAGPSSTSIYAVCAALTYPSAIKLRTIPSPLGKPRGGGKLSFVFENFKVLCLVDSSHLWFSGCDLVNGHQCSFRGDFLMRWVGATMSHERAPNG
jgi:hypothetical protein